MRILMLFLLLPQLLRGQLQQIGHLSYGNISLAGCWHYTDAKGNEYALVGTGKGLSIVDVRNPAQPAERFAVPGPANNWREVKTWNNFAYFGSEANNSGITIVNLSLLPDTIAWKTWFGPDSVKLIRTSHTVACADGYLYIFGGNQQGTVICALDDPWNPKIRSVSNAPYVHDGYIRNDTLWASEIYAGQFSAFDVSDKSQPKLLASQPTPAHFNHNAWLSDDSHTLFTTDEKPNAPLAAFDIRTLDNITRLDQYYPSRKPTFEVHNVRVFNDFLINPSYGGQLTIVDAHRPDNLVEIGWASLGKSLVWDADPYLPSGIIVATAKNEGLFVFQPTYTRAGYLEGRVTDALSGLPLGRVKVVVSDQIHSGVTSTDGTFKTGALPGTYSVVAGKIGYQALTVPDVALKPGETTWLDIALQPLK